MNTGSEINGNRPALVFKDTQSSFGDDVIVIPLTTGNAQKQPDAFDVAVQKDGVNKLFQNSYARLRQIRSVSVKRIGKKVGELKHEPIQQTINDRMKNMLATDS